MKTLKTDNQQSKVNFQITEISHFIFCPEGKTEKSVLGDI